MVWIVREIERLNTPPQMIEQLRLEGTLKDHLVQPFVGEES